MCRLSRNLGASTSWKPQGLYRGCFTFTFTCFFAVTLSVWKFFVAQLLYFSHSCQLFLSVSSVVFPFSIIMNFTVLKVVKLVGSHKHKTWWCTIHYIFTFLLNSCITSLMIINYWLKHLADIINIAVFDWLLQVLLLLVISAFSLAWPRAHYVQFMIMLKKVKADPLPLLHP
jgi:hypothetical protein